jgi:ribosomal peptide maturation radical SAM protein 1
MFAQDLSSRHRLCDAVLIVPPFAGLDRPSLAMHLLQACARTRGFEVAVLYANMLLAREIGEREYGAICFASTSNLLGERFFAPAAYGVPTAVYEGRRHGDQPEAERASHVPPMGWEGFRQLASRAEAWAEGLASQLAGVAPGIVGCTSTFEQTAASLAILLRLKRLRPDIVTILGGANCEGEMGEGMRSLAPEIDYIFSGESEVTFLNFLAAIRAGARPQERLFQGSACRDLDHLPTPDFSEYYTQLAEVLPESELAAAGSIWLPYESSRGCWWGEKSHCTFCGINGGGMVFRQKSADRVIAELKVLLEGHPTNKVCMVDNIMPHDYFRTLLPRLPEEVPGAHMFFEQKANLTLEKVRLLKTSGVAVIQPGIEALSTPLLRLMKKGVSAPQNIALLRYARAVDLAVNWNLLYAFPGDRLSWYEDTLNLLPLLAHLNPPSGLCHLSLDRFSPYFDHAKEYGIERLRPMAPYLDILPVHAEPHKLAYHFAGDYASESKGAQRLIEDLEAALATWRERWKPEAHALPALEIAPIGDCAYLLVDTRGLPGSLEFEFLDEKQAAVALVGGASNPAPETVEWALERKVCVQLDHRCVPLCTAPPDLLAWFEARRPEDVIRPWGIQTQEAGTLGHSLRAAEPAALVPLLELDRHASEPAPRREP